MTITRRTSRAILTPARTGATGSGSSPSARGLAAAVVVYAADAAVGRRVGCGAWACTGWGVVAVVGVWVAVGYVVVLVLVV